LRLRAKGRAKTSLTVLVEDHYRPVPDVEVTISEPLGNLSSRTTADGVAKFEGLKESTYRVSATKAHYRLDPDSSFNQEVQVVAGSCPAAQLALRADGSVSGFIRDSKGVPVPLLDLELITYPENSSDRVSLNKPFFQIKAGEDGNFRFESVSPGRYLLGSNIIDLNTSSVPPTFYPGQRSRNGATPIEVALGEEVSNLTFVLPDFGSLREIQVCVVDERGDPQGGAGVATNNLRHADGLFARLGEKLTTDETGCIKTKGYTRVGYPIQAIFNPSKVDWRQTRNSERIVIPPGEGPVLKVLTLGPLAAPNGQ
jgi:hypothetical protein